MSDQNYQPMTTGQWMLTTFLSYLPIAGLILLFIWAFGSGHHPSKSSWAKAMLIWQAIFLGLTIIYVIIVVAVLL
tara:strand:- start:143 stop:367 length:225 start_codon:yes stop_codon:yes gene_type:complete